MSATVAGGALAAALLILASTMVDAALPTATRKTGYLGGAMLAAVGVLLVVPSVLTRLRPGGTHKGAAAFGIAALLAAMTWSSDLAHHVWPAPELRYQHELSGTTGCLNGTPYDWSQIRAVAFSDRQMTVVPSSKDKPLVFANAYQGSTHRLIPADDATRTILETYGCGANRP
ncbi:hypothetical protein ACFY4B_27255 [Kitasatospora sp. NPDC001261]|uniref:hypothetical protein n=1 Tax=Kitasatospora sp. NPDC001261 TaxID=3364012 RepID=UPI0036961DB8